ncbi:MAG: hypothetical protein L3J83_02520 [Proteobacteria bacterium]|nr:hypothetical protein [Pseudomonadota bacterium]
MKKKIILLFGIAFGLLSTNVSAEPLCEMPPDIDDDEKYWIKFKSESSMQKYTITDIDDCWVQVLKKGTKYWFQIQDVESITAKPEEKS